MDRKVLIIDDDASHRLIYRMQIEQFLGGVFSVIEADNTEDGFELIVRERPACVVLDYMMHGGNGFHLIHHLKQAMPDHPPIIFVSCSMTESLSRNALALGAAACMEKSSMGKDDLMQAITEVTTQE